MGRKFIIFTDHRSLVWLMNFKNPTGRLVRWIIFLQMFNFEVKYLKGSENKCADALTRLECNLIREKHLSKEDEEIIWQAHVEIGHAGYDPTYCYLLKNNHGYKLAT